jgi:hypothetical protein
LRSGAFSEEKRVALPPFMNATGLIPKIFEIIQLAKVPDRYTQDFQGTVLGYGSGSARPFIPFLKRLGFLESDGRPTERYKKFRNSDTSGAAMADAMRTGFRDLFQRNEFAYELSDEKLKNLVVEVTGKAPNDTIVKAITSSFKACNQLADFDAPAAQEAEVMVGLDEPAPDRSGRAIIAHQLANSSAKLSLSYTINLNLPETTDVEVFNAIFSSLKRHLLTDE